MLIGSLLAGGPDVFIVQKPQKCAHELKYTRK